MAQCIQATVAEDGTVRLLENVHIQGLHRAIVTILEERPDKRMSALDEDGGRCDPGIVRETAGLWRGKRGDGLEYVGRLRSEWNSA